MAKKIIALRKSKLLLASSEHTLIGGIMKIRPVLVKIAIS